MTRIIVCTLAVACGVLCMSTWRLAAQQPAVRQGMFAELHQRFDQLEAALAAVRADSAARSAELSKKIDQVLARQQEMSKELEIIKIRASRR